ncbi:response regulator transcription factor [Luteococcus peritonei]|uniref:Response regulator n=1 Tax=Luteococcus peritonei TaxID=88874 RepID=A0ABW4RTK4_9ACTN
MAQEFTPTSPRGRARPAPRAMQHGEPLLDDDVRSVLLVDDEELVRESFRAFLGRQGRFHLVGEATNGRVGVEAYERLRPDVVLMDLRMPVMDGIAATTEITRRWPDACVVALTTFGSRDFIVPMLRAGAAGYLLKHAGAKAVLGAMEAAIAGDMPLSPSVRRELVRTIGSGPVDHAPSAALQVTPREQELLQWLAHGLSNAEIGARMYLSEGSVKQYLSNIGEKLSVRSRTQILVRAIQVGLVDPRQLPPISDHEG